MMHMNIQDSASQPTGGSGAPPGHGMGMGGAPLQLPPLPPEFLQAVAHQITQQAVAAAASAATGQAVGGFQTPTRVVIARPTAPPLRPTHPGAPQAAAPAPGGGASLAQVLSGLVGQLLLQPLVLAQGGSAPAAPQAPPPSSAPPTSGQAPPSSGQTPPTAASSPPGGAPGGPGGGGAGEEPPLAQLLGGLLGAGPTPAVAVAMPGVVPPFLQGVADFLQATQGSPAPPSGTPEAPPKCCETLRICKKNTQCYRR